MKVFVTKYAMTKGIQEASVTGKTDVVGTYVYSGGYSQQYRMGYTAFLTREEASMAAEAMRQRKVASLKKSIAKLEKLSFP